VTSDPAVNDPVSAQMDANRANWDERTAIHLESDFYDVEGWLASGSGPREREIQALGDVTGLSLVHLQCHFGKDTLSWARAGATVTGLDFSPAAIDAARDLSERAGLASVSRFVCANVYDAYEALAHATFDVVYVSLGAINWLPSIERWAEQVAALMAPGGRFYIHDIHPFSWALSDDRPWIEHGYFEEAEPYVDDSGETYADQSRQIENRRNYEWSHGIGEIVNSLITQGLRVDSLVEHDWTVNPRFPWLVRNAGGNWTNPGDMPRMPLTFTLLASKAH